MWPLRKGRMSWVSWGTLGQTETLIIVKGLGQPSLHNLFAAIFREVKKVVAGVGHR